MIIKGKDLFHSVPKTSVKNSFCPLWFCLLLSFLLTALHKVYECSESLKSENEDKNEVVVWEESSLCSEGYNLSHFGFGT